jgi:hypothetical protein
VVPERKSSLPFIASGEVTDFARTVLRRTRPEFLKSLILSKFPLLAESGGGPVRDGGEPIVTSWSDYFLKSLNRNNTKTTRIQIVQPTRPGHRHLDEVYELCPPLTTILGWQSESESAVSAWPKQPIAHRRLVLHSIPNHSISTWIPEKLTMPAKG